jgi:transcriptional regulator GlxA family with amidase domain
VFFSYANAHLERRRLAGRYDVKLASIQRGPVISNTGISLEAEKNLSTPMVPHTTVIVGSRNIEDAMVKAQPIIDWVRAVEKRMARIVSLCSGAFFLAEAGILDGKRATTHWAVAAELSARHPAVQLDEDCIFVREGDTWTSTDGTAGIDLTLALVEDDFG